VYIPSGALGGVDCIKSASEGEIEEVKITTTKTPVLLKE
jgi:predicted dinucleotide-utilizing enzyme